jgi:hypothetical protein
MDIEWLPPQDWARADNRFRTQLVHTGKRNVMVLRVVPAAHQNERRTTERSEGVPGDDYPPPRGTAGEAAAYEP